LSFTRRVSRAYGGTCSVCSVNVTVAQAGSAHRHRFFTQRTVTKASNGTSRTRCTVR